MAIRWQVVFHHTGPQRLKVFEAHIQPVIEAALRYGGTIYVYRDNHAAYIHTLFRAAIAGRHPSSIVILEDGQKPPPDSLVVGGSGDCPTCKPVSVDDGFAAYLTSGRLEGRP